MLQLFVTWFTWFNIAGIWAGMHTVRYFDGKTYKWVGLSRQPNIIGKVCFFSLEFDLFRHKFFHYALIFDFYWNWNCWVWCFFIAICIVSSLKCVSDSDRILFASLFLLLGETNIRPIHTGPMGQRRVASIPGSMAIYSSS